MFTPSCIRNDWCGAMTGLNEMRVTALLAAVAWFDRGTRSDIGQPYITVKWHRVRPGYRRHSGHCRLTMPGGGSHVSALVARAASSSSMMHKLSRPLFGTSHK
jgi:hypothetical protein